MDTVQYDDERLHLAEGALVPFASRGEARERVIASAALDCRAGVGSGGSQLAVESAVLSSLSHGVHGSAESLLAECALDARSRAVDVEASFRIGDWFLSRIADITPFTSVQHIVDQARYDVKTTPSLLLGEQYQSDALNAIRLGTAEVRPTPKASQPPTEPETEAQMVARLQENLAKNRGIAAGLDGVIADDGARLQQGEARNHVLVDHINELAKRDSHAITIRDGGVLGIVGSIGTAMVGGVALAAAAPPVWSLGLLGASAVALGASLVAQRVGARRHEAITAEYTPAHEEWSSLQVDNGRLRVRLDGANAVRHEVESAIRADQGQLDLIRIAHPAPAEPPPTVDVGRDEVIIGGVKVGRRSE